jgi:hypothetical protein
MIVSHSCTVQPASVWDSPDREVRILEIPNLVKRKKKPKSYFETNRTAIMARRIDKIFESELKLADESIRAQYDLDSIDSKDYIDEKLSNGRACAVRWLFEAWASTAKKYSPCLKSGLRYPYNWMTDDRRINKTLERYPMIVPMLNYLFELNRFTRGDKLGALVEITDTVTGGERYEYQGEYFKYSAIVADQEFYSEMSSALETSDEQLKKYIRVFANSGILKRLGKIRRGPYIYADGYYGEQPNGKLVKRAFLKGTTTYKNALRNFRLPR